MDNVVTAKFMDMRPKKREREGEKGVSTRGKAAQRNTKRPHPQSRYTGTMSTLESLSGNRGEKKHRPSAVPTRRSSTRLQNQKNSNTPGRPFLVDSAYDGDGESSPNTTPSEEDDPYSVATMEDVPAVPRERKKKRGKQPSAVKTVKAKIKGRASSAGGHTNSTPNQVVQPHVRRSTRNSPHLNSTPDVTPILPVEPKEVVCKDLSFTTPQIYQLARKQSPAITSVSPSLQSSSQADSGIALSPPVKRPRLQPGKKLMNKRNIFSPNSKGKVSESEAKENMDNSCFGFSSLDSPDHDRDLPVLGVYRCSQPLTTDSSPTSPHQPLISTDSENCLDYQRPCPSPGLFSDDMISADSESVILNKSSAKSYKPSKVKKLKHKKSVSKFEAWANEINMEIEDIEKFDLNIE